MITKTTTDISNINLRLGEVFLVDKPFGWTSFKVVHVLRKITGEKKIGHAGTLDPKATGLLILCTGKKTKEITNYQEMYKVYSGTFTLGITTPSMDLETEVTETKDYTGVTESQILSSAESFLGTILQVPPMYSAIKLNGKTLYNLARKGKVVEREARPVEIVSFQITGIQLPYVHFVIKCSKGTYIRVIANDFGEKLGCGAVLSALRREAIGDYSVNDALLIKDIENLFIPNLETENNS